MASDGSPCEDKRLVEVDARALVEKILARYPEKFTVFRELVQNADDAGAEKVEIEFQTNDYIPATSVEDWNIIQLSKWIVRNKGGKSFQPDDWKRITNIADGNPDEQKIGAFGVGFFSVFSITKCPVIISGGVRKKIYLEEDRLFVQSTPSCPDSEWTIIEMDLKSDVPKTIPKPFDLSRYISTAVTFLVRVKEVSILFNGSILSTVIKSSEEPVKLEVPAHLNAKTPSMIIKSVQSTAQRVAVTLSALACKAGSDKAYSKRKQVESSYIDPVQRPEFFGNGAESNTDQTHYNPYPVKDKLFSAEYTVYSAEMDCSPSNEITSGIQAATRKKPPKTFPFEAMHLTMKEYESITQEDDSANGGLGSVFTGPQGLVGDQDGEHGARLFVGQSTLQTTGIALHLSSRFIPTMERGSIDLVNGQVQKWNEELLWIGGFLARLIYERAMGVVRGKWSEDPDEARMEGLFVMQSFAFHPSTPASNVARLLRDAFFDCSTSPSFPIISNLGVQDSKDVRQPNPALGPFMKERPVLDPSLRDSSLINNLTKRYEVTPYVFRDVIEEFRLRILPEEEMVACLVWWTKLYATGGVSEEGIKLREQMFSFARFRPAEGGSSPVYLSDIRKFVNQKGSGSFIQALDPLPFDTIPFAFTNKLDTKTSVLDPKTNVLDPKTVQTCLGWEEMTIVDWIRHLTGSGLRRDHDLRHSLPIVKKVFGVLQTLWTSLTPRDKRDIVMAMSSIECIPTKFGQKKPLEVYLPEADLFDDLPVVQVTDADEQLLLDLGVKRSIPWSLVKDRLPSKSCSPWRLVAYLDKANDHIQEEERIEIQQMAIFAIEGQEDRFYRISELYSPYPLHRDLELPVIRWHEPVSKTSRDAFSPLFKLGLKEHPSLETIIERASSLDPHIRKLAFDHLIENLEGIYENYDPATFASAAFIPCGQTEPPESGTPQQVVTSPEWELLGFKRLHPSTQPKVAIRLRIKVRPDASAIINTLRHNPPRDTQVAESWFSFLSLKGGFTADDLKELSDLSIVPVTGSDDLMRPNQCFSEFPGESNKHHGYLLNFVEFGDEASRFLHMCGAKSRPECADIAEALLRNAEDYLWKTQDPGKYLDTLRRVAAGYCNLSTELTERMKNAKILLGYQTSSTKSQWALKQADEILIADDIEGQRHFGCYTWVAPKEEVFENFYRDMGSQSLSAHIGHDMERGHPLPKDGKDIRSHVLDRAKIFLRDQDSSRRSDVDPAKWHEDEKFTVKYCESLRISKHLNWKHSEHGCRDDTACQEAYAGLESTNDGNYVLWIRDKGPEAKHDWYDISVALCRLFFRIHKAHDAMLFMTILGTDSDELQRLLGYNDEMVDPSMGEVVNKNDTVEPYVPSRSRSPKSNRSPKWSPKSQTLSLFRFSEWIQRVKYYRRFRKRKRELGRLATEEELAREAMGMCTGDKTHPEGTVHEYAETFGKKLCDGKHCSSLRQVALARWDGEAMYGMTVFISSESRELPTEGLKVFSNVLRDLAEVFVLDPKKFHILWNSDGEFMGFNRNCIIYLNLAHFMEKHHNEFSTNDHAKVQSVYTTWFFIIAHEIAHNVALFHDEEHELVLASIAKDRMTAFRKLLDRVAPGAKC